MSPLRYVISFTYLQCYQTIFKLHFLTDFIKLIKYYYPSPIQFHGKAVSRNRMSLLSFETTFDTFSFYPSRRLSHDLALKPNNTNRMPNSKPKLKAKCL